tara:strand:+ start:493 stop:936 length:444 start_codon:yes stop_codon:yes gene_type:complete
MNSLHNFAEQEINLFKAFLVKFNIIGLAVGTVIGVSLANSTKIVSEELIMPFFETTFKIENFKKFTIPIYTTDINIGILISEFIKVLFILIIVFILYNFIYIYMNDILTPNYLQEENEKVKKLEHTADDTKKIQVKILNELKKLNNK